jgi:hypothetical protein
MKGYKNSTKTVYETEASAKYAKGGAVKKPKAYDPVKDEPTSRPLTADQMRNLRNRMKAAPKKRAYDPVKDEPTSRPFANGGKVGC